MKTLAITISTRSKNSHQTKMCARFDAPQGDIQGLAQVAPTKTQQRTLIIMLDFDVLFMFIHLTIESMDIRCECIIKMDYYVNFMKSI